ncbi:MAG: ATP synthase F1 subunit delta [Polyangiaceae bacterium]|nr:ATP synthase F1 subunit delta [Polyangiaceae bacterium]MCB9609194.1 ATP synthase F1 subunit delta [Polyangiaceae bacterium]
MSAGAIAERYAKAIYELADEAGQLTQVADQLTKLATVYSESQELRAVLDNPLVTEEKRESILKDVASKLGLNQLAVNSVRYIAQRRRLVALPDIARRLATLSDEKAGVIRATVISAGPLGEAYYSKLKAQLEKSTGKKVQITKEQDASLIAGVITRIGDNTIDGSLRGRLNDLERQLLNA